MGQNLRLAAICVAIVAVLTRALVPVGWMPGAAADPHSALVPCQAMGGMLMPVEHSPGQTPAKPHQETCPFAATAHFTMPVAMPSALPQRIAASHVKYFHIPPSGTNVIREWSRIPRAPPRLS